MHKPRSRQPGFFICDRRDAHVGRDFRLWRKGSSKYPPAARFRKRLSLDCPYSSFETAIAAIVPSETAVVIWRYCFDRTSPAANTPLIRVRISSSVMM